MSTFILLAFQPELSNQTALNWGREGKVTYTFILIYLSFLHFSSIVFLHITPLQEFIKRYSEAPEVLVKKILI